MKKLLSVFAVLALVSSLAATAAESRLENYLNKKLAPVTQKEKELNSKIEAQQKANEAKQAELKKQQAERQAKIEQQKKDAQARHQAAKDAIKAETDYWKSLKK